MDGHVTSRPDAIDTRLVLRIDAVLTAALGVWLIWLAHDWTNQFVPAPTPTVVRTVGGVMIAVACLVAALSGEADPRRRQRGLVWLIAAHVVVVVALVAQRFSGGSVGRGVTEATGLIAAMAVGLLYVRLTAEGQIGGSVRSLTTLFGSRGEPATETLRSRYEQQIREVAQQEERNRLARDLHDSVKQQIFAIHTAAATAEARLGGDPPGVRDALEQVRASSREAMAEMEAMLDQLRATPLDRTGFIDALTRQCDALRFRTGADVQFTHGALPPSEACGPGTYQTLFRVAQEALSNVGRHARAGAVRVSLDAVAGLVVLEVQDDGAGVPPAAPSSGMGIANMRARTEEIGGTLTVAGRPGGGTVVRCEVPCASPEDRVVVKRQLLWFGAAGAAVFLLNVPYLRASFLAPSVAAISGIQVIRSAVGYWRLTRRIEGGR